MRNNDPPPQLESSLKTRSERSVNLSIRGGWLPLRVITALILAGILGACMTPANLRARNRGRVNQLSVGLVRDEVLAIMGTQPQWVCLGGPACFILPLIYIEQATIPLRTEGADAPDGTELEIFFYQTETRKADGAITDDELSPIVLEDGRLVGWGWVYLRQNTERYDIKLR